MRRILERAKQYASTATGEVNGLLLQSCTLPLLLCAAGFGLPALPHAQAPRRDASWLSVHVMPVQRPSNHPGTTKHAALTARLPAPIQPAPNAAAECSRIRYGVKAVTSHVRRVQGSQRRLPRRNSAVAAESFNRRRIRRSTVQRHVLSQPGGNSAATSPNAA